MPLSRTNIASTSGQVGAGALTTAAGLTVSGGLVVAVQAGQKNASNGVNATTVMTMANSGTALTWTKQVTAADLTADGFGLVIWSAPVVTGASITFTADGGAQNFNSSYLGVMCYAGQDVSPFGATATDLALATNGADTMTLSGTPLATSEVVVARCGGVPGTGTALAAPAANHTEIYDLSVNDNGGLQIEVQNVGTGSATVGWSDVCNGTSATLVQVIGAALEIKEAAGVIYVAPKILVAPSMAVHRAGRW